MFYYQIYLCWSVIFSIPIVIDADMRNSYTYMCTKVQNAILQYLCHDALVIAIYLGIFKGHGYIDT